MPTTAPIGNFPDPETFKIMAVCGTIVFGIGFAAYAGVTALAFWHPNTISQREFLYLLRRTGFHLTIVTIVAATGLLGAIGRLSDASIVAVFSGIAGFVLGASKNNGPRSAPRFRHRRPEAGQERNP